MTAPRRSRTALHTVISGVSLMTAGSTKAGSRRPIYEPIHDSDVQTKRMALDHFYRRDEHDAAEVLPARVYTDDAQGGPGPNNPNVLDIGCGVGIGRRMGYTGVVSAMAGELSEVEPDATTQEIPSLFAHAPNALPDDARLPENQFDQAVPQKIKQKPDPHANHDPVVSRCNSVREVNRYALAGGLPGPTSRSSRSMAAGETSRGRWGFFSTADSQTPIL